MLPSAPANADGGGTRRRLNAGETAPVPQLLLPVTVTVPETADKVKSTVIEGLFAPLTMLAPAGSVQLYEVANKIGVTEKTTPDFPLQIVFGPVIVPASPGKGSTVTVNEGEIAPDPQLLVPLTDIVPETADPEKLTVMEEVLFPATIVAPVGNVHE